MSCARFCGDHCIRIGIRAKWNGHQIGKMNKWYLVKWHKTMTKVRTQIRFWMRKIWHDLIFMGLTHWGRLTHLCVSELTIIGSDNGLSPSHYLKQCWIIVNWTLRNKLHWNFKWNSNIFIQENSLEHVVCEIASILSRPQCVNYGVSIVSTFEKVMTNYQCKLQWLICLYVWNMQVVKCWFKKKKTNQSHVEAETRTHCFHV